MESKTPVIDKLVSLGRMLYPTTTFFELTHRCNGRCDYCYVKDKDKAEDLDTKSVFHVLDKLVEAGIMHLIFTGGEIFIRDDILEILKHAISGDFWLIGLLTNGTLLTRDHMDFIVDNKVRFCNGVSMSIFSHIPEVNDSYFCIPGALEKIIANGEYLMEKGVAVQLKLNVLAFNLETFMETHRILTQKGFIVEHYCETSYSPGALPGSKREILIEYFRRIPASELKARKEEFASGMQARKKLDFCIGRNKMVCIDNKGNLTPCLRFPSEVPCNILEKGPLRELLGKSSTMKNVRAVSKQDVAKCRDCRFFNCCNPCLAEMMAEHGCFSYPPSSTCRYAHAIHEV